MPLDPSIILQGQVPDVGESINNAVLNAGRMSAMQTEQLQRDLIAERLSQLQNIGPINERLVTAQAASAEQGVIAPLIKQAAIDIKPILGTEQGKISALRRAYKLKEEILSSGVQSAPQAAKSIDSFIDAIEMGDDAAAKSMIDGILGVKPLKKADLAGVNIGGTNIWATAEQAAGLPMATKDPLASVTTNVDMRKTNPFAAELAKKMGEDFVKQREDAASAVKSLESANQGVKLLNSGIITGFGADFITGFGSALKQLGLYDGEAVDNTQAYMANQAKQVADIIKAFGSGTGLSDADREYAEKAAGGKIAMTEEAIRRIIDINMRASMNVIERFNKKAEQANKENVVPFDLRVEVPEVLSPVSSSDDDLIRKYLK